MGTSVLRSSFKNNHGRGVCLQSVAGNLQSSRKYDSSSALSADSLIFIEYPKYTAVECRFGYYCNSKQKQTNKKTTIICLSKQIGRF